MRLTPLNGTLIEPNEQAELAPEDAWLNDRESSSRPQISNKKTSMLEEETEDLCSLPYRRGFPGEDEDPDEEVPPSESETQSDTYTLIEYAELLSQQDMPTPTEQASSSTPPAEAHIGPGHRLWSIMLCLSERIWHEVYQKPGIGHMREPALIDFVRSRALDVLRTDCSQADQVHDLAEAEQLLQGIVGEVLGYGPLEALLRSEDISEITALGPQLTYVVRNGKLQEVPTCFEDDHHMSRIIKNIVRHAGQRIEPNWPMADVRLPEGMYANIVMPPHAIHGPTITIRKSAQKSLSIADLVELGSLTQEMTDFLAACMQARLNIVVCGGIGSGRTTLLHALGAYIPTEQRIVTIEDVAELQLSQKHVVALEVRQSDGSSAKRVTMRDFVSHALCMRPERLIVGECRGSEVVELLQAMYSGCNGVLTSVYAHNPRDCLTRLEVMCLLGGLNLPITTIRAQLAGALDMIVYLSCLRDGSRKIMNIAEVQGAEDGIIRLQNIFHYQDMGVDAATSKLQGMFRPGGFRPHCMAKFEAANIQLPREMFAPTLVGQLNGKR